MKQKEKRPLAWLFGVNLLIGAFTFGGGYVVVPMIRKYYVERKRLFTEEELLEMAAIAQSTPGAIAVNLSVLAGYRAAGLGGAALSCLATLVPPLLILSVVSVCYDAFLTNPWISAALRGMQAGVAALIVDLTVDLCRAVLRERSVLLTVLVPCVFLGSFFLHINVALLIGGSCLLCIGRVALQRRHAV